MVQFGKREVSRACTQTPNLSVEFKTSIFGSCIIGSLTYQNQTVFLIGSRGTGKSTLLKQQFTQAEVLRIDLLDGARLDPNTTKIAVTTRLDPDVLSWLRIEAEKKGIPYQTLMNSILTEAMHRPSESEEFIRKIVREELNKKTG